jgi:hypothetical protein
MAYLQGARVANYFLVQETSFNLGTTCHELAHVWRPRLLPLR